MARQAAIVVDLGFGDAGKGLLTDYLVRKHSAHTVVRFNGGGQAGHRVVDADGRSHVCSHFAAAVFVPGVALHLSQYCTVHPGALLREAAVLASQGAPDALARLSIAASAPLVTPFHQAANRLRELGRGAARHGSCGLGIGELGADVAAAAPWVLRADALAQPRSLLAGARAVQAAKCAELAELRHRLRSVPEAAPELAVLEGPDVAEDWISSLAPLQAARRVVPNDWLGERLAAPGDVVFEGAQGVLLDEWRGFHPFTTWSTCTFQNAQALLAQYGYTGSVRRHGVIRCYATRHGAGPFPTEFRDLAQARWAAALPPEAHNTLGPWQGAFRRGPLDLVLLSYAAACCREGGGAVDELTVTHLDALPSLRSAGFDGLSVCDRYAVSAEAAPLFELDAASLASSARLGPPQSLDYQARLAAALERVTPQLRSLPLHPVAIAEYLQAALAIPVARGSFGPSAAEVRERANL